MTQIPHADKGLICPLHKVDVSKVCHHCPWWTRVLGKNPQSEEMIDRWQCAISLLPMLLVENSQQQHQTKVAVEMFRNSVETAQAGLPCVDVNNFKHLLR